MPVASADGCSRSTLTTPPRPRRMSRKALQATHIRNTYRTARNPNFSPTETGASWTLARWTLLELKFDHRSSDLELVARLDHLGSLDPAAVDTRPVRGAEIGQHPGTSTRADLRMLARDVWVVEDDIALS